MWHFSDNKYNIQRPLWISEILSFNITTWVKKKIIESTYLFSVFNLIFKKPICYFESSPPLFSILYHFLFMFQLKQILQRKLDNLIFVSNSYLPNIYKIIYFLQYWSQFLEWSWYASAYKYCAGTYYNCSDMSRTTMAIYWSYLSPEF